MQIDENQRKIDERNKLEATNQTTAKDANPTGKKVILTQEELAGRIQTENV